MDVCFSEKQDHSMKISEKKDEVCKSIRSVWNNYKLTGFTYFTHFGLTYKLDLFCSDTSLQEPALLRRTSPYDLNCHCAELLQIGRLFLLIWLILADFVLKNRFIVLSDGSLVWTSCDLFFILYFYHTLRTLPYNLILVTLLGRQKLWNLA